MTTWFIDGLVYIQLHQPAFARCSRHGVAVAGVHDPLVLLDAQP